MSLRKERAVVLLSGGLDSTVTLAAGARQFEVVLALTMNYGQRAFGKEIRASRQIAEYYNVRHEIIALPWLSALLPQAMTMRKEGRDPEIPMAWIADEEKGESFFDAQPVWVPNRNGLFLNIAATYAEANDAQAILFGANAEEAERFPDNTQAFRDRMTHTLELSTLTHPRVETPVGEMTKSQIIDLAKELEVPLHLIWSCYTDAEKQCGYCPSCHRLKQALQDAVSGSSYLKQFTFIK